MDILLNIDLRNKQAKSFFNYIKTLDFVKITTTDSNVFLKELENAVIEAEEKRNKKGKPLKQLLDGI